MKESDNKVNQLTKIDLSFIIKELTGAISSMYELNKVPEEIVTDMRNLDSCVKLAQDAMNKLSEHFKVEEKESPKPCDQEKKS